MTTTDAARLLGVTDRTIARYVATGVLLTCGRLGRHVLLDASSVARMYHERYSTCGTTPRPRQRP